MRTRIRIIGRTKKELETEYSKQLGMPKYTAHNILRKSILLNLLVQLEQNICYRCGEPMTIDTISTDHKKNWINSGEESKLFFDLDNISFSHKSCNIKHREPSYQPCGTPAKYQQGCRCDNCIEACKIRSRNFYKKAIEYTGEKHDRLYVPTKEFINKHKK